MTKKRTYNDRNDESDRHDRTKRARLSPTRMYSVPPSPTDRENLELYKESRLDLARVNEKLIEFQQLRDWVEECRSEGESSCGDSEIVQLADWGWKGQRDTPLTQYDDEDEHCGTLEIPLEASGSRHWFSLTKDDVSRDHDDWRHPLQPTVYDPYDSKLRDGSDVQALSFVKSFKAPTAPIRGRAGRWSLALLRELSDVYR